MPTSSRPLRRGAWLLATALTGSLVTACASAAGAPPSSDPGGGGAPGAPGTGGGIVLPIDPTPIDPGPGQPTIVIPRPGRLNPHPVAPIWLRSSADGRHVFVKIAWYGGVAPCSALDSVKVERSGMTIALTVIEGADQLDAVCPELAMLKATIVDVGELGPGTWTISAPKSDAAPIEVTLT